MRVKRKQKPVYRRLVKKPKNPKVLKKIAIALAIVLTATVLYVKFLQPHTLEVKQTLKLQSTQQQLKSTLDNLQKTKTNDVKQQQTKDQQIQQLQKQLQDTQQQLQAKAAQKAQAVAYAAEIPSPVVEYTPPTNDYKAYIYDHESGNNPGAINAGSGACGLGQALPCSKLPCGLSDYACQDAYFTNYAIQRYGSWEAAYNFWVSHKWW